MKDYRYFVYITRIYGSSKTYYYAGKHATEGDFGGYYGSGTLVKTMIGMGRQHDTRVVSEFDSELDAFEFEELLVREMKDTFGRLCINIAGGGYGGNTRKYMTSDAMEQHRKRLSDASFRRWESVDERAKQSLSQKVVQSRPDVKKKVSDGLRKFYSIPENRNRRSEISSMANSRPETKDRQSKSQKLAKRSGVVWDAYDNGTLTKIWYDNGCPGYVSLCKMFNSQFSTKIDKSKFQKPVIQMRKDTHG